MKFCPKANHDSFVSQTFNCFVFESVHSLYVHCPFTRLSARDWVQGFTLHNCTSGPSYILLAGVNSGGAIQLDNVKAFFHGMVMEHNTGELGGSMLIFNSLVRITDSEFRCSLQDPVPAAVMN